MPRLDGPCPRSLFFCLPVVGILLGYNVRLARDWLSRRLGTVALWLAFLASEHRHHEVERSDHQASPGQGERGQQPCIRPNVGLGLAAKLNLRDSDCYCRSTDRGGTESRRLPSAGAIQGLTVPAEMQLGVSSVMRAMVPGCAANRVGDEGRMTSHVRQVRRDKPSSVRRSRTSPVVRLLEGQLGTSVHLSTNVDHLIDATADIFGQDLPNIHDCLLVYG